MKKLLASSLILLLSACNDYEVQEVGQNILLLNKSKGDVSIIDKGMVIELPKYSFSLEKHLSSNNSFEEQLQVSIKSKVTFDRVFYKMTLEGKKTTNQDGSTDQKDFGWFKKAMKENERNYITLKYQDKDEYPLFDRKIELEEFSYNDVNYEDVRTGLVYEGSFSIKPQVTNKVDSLTFVYQISALDKFKEEP